MNSLSLRRRFSLIAIAASSLGMVLAAGTDLGIHRGHASELEPLSGHAAYDFAVAHLAARAEATDEVSLEHSLAELLPNQKFSIAGARPEPLAAGFVIGVITSFEPGAGYVVDGDEGSPGRVVSFEEPDALWRVAELEVAVESSFDGAIEDGSTIRVGLAFDGPIDPRTMENGLVDRRVLMVLDQPGLFSHNSALYSLGGAGSLLGFVRDGDVSMPLLGESEEAFVGSLDTVKELTAAAAATVPVIDVELEHQVPVRDE